MRKGRDKLRIRSTKAKAFTLIESVIALFCMTLVVVLLSSGTKLVQQSNKFLPRTNEVAYAYQKLQNFLAKDDGYFVVPEESTSVKVVIRKIGPIDETTGKPTFTSYAIEQYRTMIRVRGVTSGHMPLLTGLKTAFFKADEQGFSIELREQNGSQTELLFKTKHKAADFAETEG